MERNLKAEALLERVAQLTQQYENQIADLRVTLTVQNQEIQELHQRLENITPKDVDVQKEEQEGS